MKVTRLIVGPLATNCYIVKDPLSPDCLIIDPGSDGEDILKKVRDLEGIVRGIVLTHGHFDHWLAAGIVQRSAAVPVWMGQRDIGLLTDSGWMNPFMSQDSPSPTGISPLEDGDNVKCGSVSLKAIHTPGHSPGSICLYTPGHLFSGDLIFKEGVGRTDLPGGDSHELFGSIARSVMSLPDETRIYPGHGSLTTVRHERTANPFL